MINIPQALTSLASEINTIQFYSFSSNREFAFYAFITDFNDQFTTNWNNTEIYGRMDPVYNFKNTVRKISLGFDCPSADMAEAEKNSKKLDLLISSLYPVYATGSAGTSLISSPPLWRIRLGNLIVNTKKTQTNLELSQNAQTTGLLGYIDGCAYKPDLESGWFIDYATYTGTGDKKTRTSFNTMYAKLFKVNFTFNVIHEHPLGWNVSGDNHVRREGGAGNDLKFPHRYKGIDASPETPTAPGGGGPRSDRDPT